MPDTTHDAPRGPGSFSDRDGDPADDWLVEAVQATTLHELREVATAARAAGNLTLRDQAWCRALALHLSDMDSVAMREAVRQLGARPVTGNGSSS